MRQSLNLWQQIRHNKRMSTMVIIGFALFAALFVWAVTVFFDLPPAGMIPIGLVLGLVMMLQYSMASKMVLGISGARPLQRGEYPFIWHSVEGLAIAAGMPTPKCYIIDSPAPNAFATGRNPKEGVIALTTGLISKLNNEEIEGVIAHELAHIQNYDIRLATITIAFVGIISLVGELVLRSIFWGGMGGGRRSSRRQGKGGGGGILILVGLVFMILAPIFAKLLHLVLSRRREYLADTSGAMLTRNPGGLASALKKIAGDPAPLESASKTTAPLYIVNPLNKLSGGASLFSTHPPIQQRIEILERLSYQK